MLQSPLTFMNVRRWDRLFTPRTFTESHTYRIIYRSSPVIHLQIRANQSIKIKLRRGLKMRGFQKTTVTSKVLLVLVALMLLNLNLSGKPN